MLIGERIDALGMWEATHGLAEQIEVAAARAGEQDDLPSADDVDHVVIMGMGGSGIAGNIVHAVVGPLCPKPIIVTKGYACPSFVGRRSLVFAISFSGGTEETIEAATAAEAAGAHMIVVTVGGELGRLAREWGAPTYLLDESIPMPRAAVGAVSVPPMVGLERIGLFPGGRDWIAQAVDQLRRRRDELTGADSPATAIARRIGRTFPLVYGGGDLGATAALRWKAQVNENAKSPAMYNTLPEACHNELAGWGQSGDVTRQIVSLVNLRHDFEHPQIQRRFEFNDRYVEEVVADIIEVRAQGDGQLAQLFDLMLVGDYVSLELAAAEDVDPGPIPTLNDLKTYLAN